MPALPNLPAILPDYANLDGAFEVTIPFETALDAGDRLHTTDSRFVEIVVAVRALYTAGPAVGNRLFALLHQQPDGAQVSEIPAASVQTAGQLVSYQWTTAVTDFTALTTTQVMPMVVLPMTGGWSLLLREVNGFLDGTFLSAFLTLIRVPTGPPPQADPLLVTPAIV